MRVLAYCLMPNHWHMVLYPRADGDLSRFLQRITLTHTQRYHAKTRTAGYGHIYQGRYKSLPVEGDSHFLTLVRYVERNARRAGLVKRAEEWPWSSVYARLHGSDSPKGLLSPWPVPEPGEYLECLNHSQPQGRGRNDPKCNKKKQAVRIGGVGKRDSGAVRAGKHGEEPMAPW
jgi:putative transposase